MHDLPFAITLRNHGFLLLFTYACWALSRRQYGAPKTSHTFACTTVSFSKDVEVFR